MLMNMGRWSEKEHSIWKHVPLISFINIILLAFLLSEPEPCIGYMLHAKVTCVEIVAVQALSQN